jgi:hypothetical protein
MWARVLNTLDVEVYPDQMQKQHMYGGGNSYNHHHGYATKGAEIMPLDEQIPIGTIVDSGVEIIETEVYPETPVAMPQEIPQVDIIEEIPEELPEELPEEIPGEIPEEEIPEEIPEEIIPEEDTGPIMKVKGNVVNVRSGPGTNFPVVSKVNRGDVVRISDQAFGWYKVTLPDNITTGWIASWLLAAPKG